MHASKAALKFSGEVVLHLWRLLSLLRSNETKLCHKLASVAYSKTHSILSGIEIIQCCLCLVIVEESACPALCRAKSI